MQYSPELLTKYALMEPWEGKEYRSGAYKKLLVIGESHYLPPGSTIHETADSWYGADQDKLCCHEKQWINTAGIIQGWQNGSRAKAFLIYNRLADLFNEVGPGYDKKEMRKAFDHIAYYNYFRRPAQSKVSISGISDLDKQVALEYFRLTVEKLKPELVLFVSKLAWGVFAEHETEFPELRIARCPHPSTRYWTKTVKKYDNRSGCEVVRDFLIDNDWNTVSG